MRAMATAIVFVAMVGTTTAQHAQTLQEGTWPGVTVLPDGSSAETDFDVTVDDGVLAITYHFTLGPVPLTDISLEGDTLSYVFSAGSGGNIRCTVRRQDDGSYDGECRSSSGQTGRHTMKPPNAP